MKRLPVAGVCLAVLLLATGCPGNQDPVGDSKPTSRNRTDPGNEEADSTPGTPGVFAGRVILHGPVPPSRKIQANKDVETCGLARADFQSVQVNADGAVSGVVVEIRGVKPPDDGFQWQHPEDGYVLRQKGCAFHPYVLVMPAGAELTVYNDDPVAHNVNTGQWNLMQLNGAEPIKESLAVGGGRQVRVTCNIHSWMECWVYQAETPYFATTDGDGRLRIEGIPPGTYRAIAWHPSLGRNKFDVELNAGDEIEVEIVFESPVKE